MDFDTKEKVKDLFTNAGASLNNDTFLVAFKDNRKNTGMVGGMDYPYDAMLINVDSEGLNLLMLKQEGSIVVAPLSA